jgi:hypothetical protein
MKQGRTKRDPKSTKLILIDDLWVVMENEKYLLSIENINFSKYLRKGINISSTVLFSFLLTRVKAGAVDDVPFRVYKNSKEITDLFKASNDLAKIETISSSRTLPSIFLLLSLFQNYQLSKQTQLLQKSIEQKQLQLLKNRELLKVLVVSGGKIALSISLAFSGVVILLALRLGKSDEIKEKIKDFESKQIFLFCVQLVVVAYLVLLDDLKSLPIFFSKLELHTKLAKLITQIANSGIEYFEMFTIAFMLVAGLISFTEYILLPILFRYSSGFEFLLDEYHVRLSEKKVLSDLLKLYKDISKLETVKIKDKSMIKVASTGALLERTFNKKLFHGLKMEMLRLMNELPPKKIDPNFKPSYFYKMHRVYRIRQNAKAIVWFLIYLKLADMENNFPFVTDVDLNSLPPKDQNNSSESF